MHAAMRIMEMRFEDLLRQEKVEIISKEKTLNSLLDE